ncbi:DNA-processing protein DprA [Clostridium chrysemydis]|uniref:DNA-processing protein DprA n=1 Tax=Clostridium chrysemydis TaxID=2665504 RepID=UPI0018831700|nr:DNA-processing protein DprA [Clostridium chrysemydis]
MEKFILWLISMDISNRRKLFLISKYGKEKEIFDKFEIIKCEYPNIFKKFKNYNKEEELKSSEEFLLKLEALNISFITITMEEYPEKLKRLDEPPYFMFYKGNIKLLNEPTVGVVGSRRHSTYGEKATNVLVKEMAKVGFTIVSGGALGIDAVAHKSALNNNGNTIAVLGSGIDVLYPNSNRFLLEEISKYGLLLSEFPLGTKPFAFNFPRRNRIISALSYKLLVPEAKKGSGSIITVDLSNEIGIEVGVVPGSIFSEYNVGTNMLLSEGATIVYDKQSLYDFLNVDYEKETEIEDDIQNKILEIISDEPVHVDDLLKKSKVDRNTFYRLLFEMQINNKIMNLPGEYYVRVL